MSKTAIARIDLSALTHNLNEIKRLMPNQKVLPMIKGNAYGHGLLKVAAQLSSEYALGVANLDEAVKIDNAKFNARSIVVMRGFCNEEELHYFASSPYLIACVHDQSQLAILKNTQLPTNCKINIWLKLDTGMHRLGFLIEDFPDVYQQLRNLKNVVLKTIFTHLADADNEADSFTKIQLKRFSDLTADIDIEKSVLNSAGIFAFPQVGYDWIRPGIALYGGVPFPFHSPLSKSMPHLKPVMTLISQIIAVKRILPGETIGYGCTYRATKEMKIAVVGIGYGDGYPRHAKSGTPVVINGQRCSMVGRVSMDMVTVDVSSLKNVAVGDEVFMWGHPLVTVDEVAYFAESIPHDLLTHMTGRVSYEYTHSTCK